MSKYINSVTLDTTLDSDSQFIFFKTSDPTKILRIPRANVYNAIISLLVGKGGAADKIIKVNSSNNDLTGLTITELLQGLISGNNKYIRTNSSGNIIIDDVAALGGFPGDYIEGFEIDFNSGLTQIEITGGYCKDSTNTYDLEGPDYNKTFAAFVPGTGKGCLDTGAALIAYTVYYVFLIVNKDTEPYIYDYLISENETAPTLPSGYDAFKLIGSFKTNATQPVKFYLRNFRELYEHGINGVNLSSDVIEGFKPDNISTASLDIEAGRVFAIMTNNEMLRTLTKSLVAWSVGNGGILDATLVNNSQYYVFSISKGGKEADILASTSATAPTLPGGYDEFRIIGMFKTDGSGNIKLNSYFRTNNVNGVGAYSKFLEIQPQGTNAGDTVATTWTTRVLNTEMNNQIVDCELASNQIFLKRGKYYADAMSSLYSVDIVFRLYDVTNAQSLACFNCNDYDKQRASQLSTSAYFDIVADAYVELQYYAKNVVTDGLGIAFDISGRDELYSVLNIKKVADY